MTPGKPLLKNTNTHHISRIAHLIETTMLPLNRAQKMVYTYFYVVFIDVRNSSLNLEKQVFCIFQKRSTMGQKIDHNLL